MTMQIAAPLIPASTNTPIDARVRISTLEDVPAIQLPYIGMLFFCVETGRHYVVLTLKNKTIGALSVPDAQIDTYAPVAGNSLPGYAQIVRPTSALALHLELMSGSSPAVAEASPLAVTSEPGGRALVTWWDGETWSPWPEPGLGESGNLAPVTIDLSQLTEPCWLFWRWRTTDKISPWLSMRYPAVLLPGADLSLSDEPVPEPDTLLCQLSQALILQTECAGNCVLALEVCPDCGDLYYASECIAGVVQNNTHICQPEPAPAPLPKIRCPRSGGYIVAYYCPGTCELTPNSYYFPFSSRTCPVCGDPLPMVCINGVVSYPPHEHEEPEDPEEPVIPPDPVVIPTSPASEEAVEVPCVYNFQQCPGDYEECRWYDLATGSTNGDPSLLCPVCGEPFMYRFTCKKGVKTRAMLPHLCGRTDEPVMNMATRALGSIPFGEDAADGYVVGGYLVAGYIKRWGYMGCVDPATGTWAEGTGDQHKLHRIQCTRDMDYWRLRQLSIGIGDAELSVVVEQKSCDHSCHDGTVGSGLMLCMNCGGSGEEMTMQDDGEGGWIEVPGPCSNCSGSGRETCWQGTLSQAEWGGPVTRCPVCVNVTGDASITVVPPAGVTDSTVVSVGGVSGPLHKPLSGILPGERAIVLSGLAAGWTVPEGQSVTVVANQRATKTVMLNNPEATMTFICVDRSSGMIIPADTTIYAKVIFYCPPVIDPYGGDIQLNDAELDPPVPLRTGATFTLSAAQLPRGCRELAVRIAPASGSLGWKFGPDGDRWIHLQPGANQITLEFDKIGFKILLLRTALYNTDMDQAEFDLTDNYAAVPDGATVQGQSYLLGYGVTHRMGYGLYYLADTGDLKATDLSKYYGSGWEDVRYYDGAAYAMRGSVWRRLSDMQDATVIADDLVASGLELPEMSFDLSNRMVTLDSGYVKIYGSTAGGLGRAIGIATNPVQLSPVNHPRIREILTWYREAHNTPGA